MSFEAKINTYFLNANFSLGNSGKPSSHLLHLYSDYVEIISLFSNNNYLSTSDILDRFRDEGIIRTQKSDKERAEHNDRKEAWIDDIFRILKDRATLFQDDYPFEILNGNKIRLKHKESIVNRQKIYLFLLIASNLNIFDIFQPEVTTEFEIISFQVLKYFMPNHATVKSFGKTTNYKGSAIDKIKQLANELNVTIDSDTMKQVSVKGNQERGLDVVGWIPFRDQVSNQLLILGQCACGKNWSSKLLDSRRYERYYNFHRNKPIHAMFIPYALIDFQNSIFFQSDDLSVDTLVFERKRILSFILDDIFFDGLESKKLIDKCIQYEEDIV